MWPAISLSYENAELDIMQRMPRNPKRDHLVTAKMICHAYPVMGILESAGAMYTYFYVFNDYGFKFTNVVFLNLEPGFRPFDTDVYDPEAPMYGNSRWGQLP